MEMKTKVEIVVTSDSDGDDGGHEVRRRLR